jgi:hypothetical protein
MLAEAVGLFSPRISVLMSTSFRHEIQTHLTSLFVDLLRPTIPLLRRNIGRGRNSDVGIDEEESQDLAMAWLSLVVEFERLNTVLENIREDQKTAFAGQNLPDHLHSRHLESDQRRP